LGTAVGVETSLLPEPPPPQADIKAATTSGIALGVLREI
jgi:hypothetical protein